MKILAIGTSNNRQSINRTLASFAAQLIRDAEVEVLELLDYELPLYSDDRERELGSPEPAQAFYKKISEADAIVVSFVEHNGSYTAAYKNLFDWASRLGKEVYQGKPSVFLSTSPGAGGAQSVLKSAVESATYFGADLAASLSVPRFHDNFDIETGAAKNAEIEQQLVKAMTALESKVKLAA